MHRFVFAALLVACAHSTTNQTSTSPKPIEPAGPTQPVVETNVPPGPMEPRTDFDAGGSPTTVVVTGNHLVWTDTTGAIWTMLTTGGKAKKLSDQHGIGFAFHAVVVGGDVYVSVKNDFVRVTLPDGPVTPLGLKLPESPVEVVSDGQQMFVTMFKRDEIFAIPVHGGAPQQLAMFKRGTLAAHAGKVYAVSYTGGNLVSISRANGVQQIAKGFARATALAVDDTHAFVYTEKDKTLHKVDLVSGAATKLAKGLNNSDDLVSDGANIYTVSWPTKLLRIPKEGGKPPEVIADDLGSPSHVAVTPEAVFVTSRDQNKIVRFKK